uniref:Uncharacterized protein n=1 Tax=Anopheles atroparvus TaxID=41427 RepID=A0AAG5D2V4_ANOAO
GLTGRNCVKEECKSLQYKGKRRAVERKPIHTQAKHLPSNEVRFTCDQDTTTTGALTIKTRPITTKNRKIINKKQNRRETWLKPSFVEDHYISVTFIGCQKKVILLGAHTADVLVIELQPMVRGCMTYRELIRSVGGRFSDTLYACMIPSRPFLRSGQALRWCPNGCPPGSAIRRFQNGDSLDDISGTPDFSAIGDRCGSCRT